MAFIDLNKLTRDEEREIVRKRFAAKYIVWDYCPDKEGNYGVIEKTPTPTDRAFQHGFVFKQTKVCALHHSYAGISDFEVQVYNNNVPLDETFENRNKWMWHLFSTKEGAEEYSAKIKTLFPEHLTLESILPLVQKVFPKARISEGRRGYETNTKPYRVIVADNGWTTFDVTENLIGVQFGQSGYYIIPHTELIEPAFTNIKDRYINLCYCVSEGYWLDFYRDK